MVLPIINKDVPLRTRPYFILPYTLALTDRRKKDKIFLSV